MGADLYMNKTYKVNEKKYRPKLEKLMAEKANYEDGSKEFKEARKKLLKLYNKLYNSDCYYRDSYNDGSLLWALGLSWWSDITKLIDDEGNMSATMAREFIELLEGAEITISVNFQKQTSEDGWSHDDCVSHFEKRKVELLDFLKKCIDTEDTIGCSI